jgi:hypothetical protein
MIPQSSLKAVIETNRALTETDFRAELRQIKVPTLTTLHAHDKDASAHSRERIEDL